MALFLLLTSLINFLLCYLSVYLLRVVRELASHSMVRDVLPPSRPSPYVLLSTSVPPDPASNIVLCADPLELIFSKLSTLENQDCELQVAAF